MDFKEITKSLLPYKVVNNYRRIKQKIKQLPPYPQIANPVAQIYILDDNFSTTLSINNFVSFLSPLSKSDGNLLLKFYSYNGSTLFKESIPLGKFHSKFIDIREKFKNLGIHEKMGIVSSKFLPSSLFSHLKIDSFFVWMFFRPLYV